MANPTVAPDHEAVASQRAAFNFKAILQQMVQLNASDLHLKVGRPPTLRVNGDLSPLPLPALRPEDLTALAKELMARGVPAGELDPAAGLWGGFFATYAVKAFGTVGAWIMVALAASVLAAATLRWNPIRAIVGPSVQPGTANRELGTEAPALVGAPDADKRKRKRAKKGEVLAGTPADVATTLAPTPEEMPAIDPSLMRDAVPELEEEDGDVDLARDRKKRERKSKSDLAADRDERVHAEIDSTAVAIEFGGDELPPTEILSPPPPRNVEVGKRELDLMAFVAMSGDGLTAPPTTMAQMSAADPNARNQSAIEARRAEMRAAASAA